MLVFLIACSWCSDSIPGPPVWTNQKYPRLTLAAGSRRRHAAIPIRILLERSALPGILMHISTGSPYRQLLCSPSQSSTGSKRRSIYQPERRTSGLPAPLRPTLSAVVVTRQPTAPSTIRDNPQSRGVDRLRDHSDRAGLSIAAVIDTAIADKADVSEAVIRVHVQPTPAADRKIHDQQRVREIDERQMKRRVEERMGGDGTGCHGHLF